MNATQAGRLLTLAYFLKTEVPPQQFDMDSWCFHANGRRPRHIEPNCGTEACALGWATAVWPQQFRFEWDGYAYGVVQIKIDRHWKVAEPECADTQQFFGITEEEGYDLFGGDGLNHTPKQKAAQIEKLVESHGYVYGN